MFTGVHKRTSMVTRSKERVIINLTKSNTRGVGERTFYLTDAQEAPVAHGIYKKGKTAVKHNSLSTPYVKQA